MKVQIVTTVFFRKPDEQRGCEAYKLHHDMAIWRDVSTSDYWAFTATFESQLEGGTDGNAE